MKPHYIYGIYNRDHECIYVGYSPTPRERIKTHRQLGKLVGLDYGKILEVFIEPEYRWVQKMLEEGQPLQNTNKTYKEKSNYEFFEEGDIIYERRDHLMMLLDRESKNKRKVLKRKWKNRRRIYNRELNPHLKEYTLKEETNYVNHYRWNILDLEGNLLDGDLEYFEVIEKYYYTPQNYPKPVKTWFSKYGDVLVESYSK